MRKKEYVSTAALLAPRSARLISGVIRGSMLCSIGNSQAPSSLQRSEDKRPSKYLSLLFNSVQKLHAQSTIVPAFNIRSTISLGIMLSRSDDLTLEVTKISSANYRYLIQGGYFSHFHCHCSSIQND